MLDSAVEEFLVSNNYGKYKTQFARHHITNDMFTDISYQDLKEIGIPSINDRARLALLIAQTCHPQKRAVGKKKTSLKPPTTPLVITPRSTSMKTPSLNSAMFESPASAQPSISSKKKLSLDTKDLSSPKIDPVSPLAQLKSLGFLPDERRSADEKREFVSDILDMDHVKTVSCTNSALHSYQWYQFSAYY